MQQALQINISWLAPWFLILYLDVTRARLYQLAPSVALIYGRRYFRTMTVQIARLPSLSTALRLTTVSATPDVGIYKTEMYHNSYLACFRKNITLHIYYQSAFLKLFARKPHFLVVTLWKKNYTAIFKVLGQVMFMHSAILSYKLTILYYL